MEIYKKDAKLIQAALRGDKEAVRMISGSFSLIVRDDTKELFRLYGTRTPQGYSRTAFGYDEEGFLLPQYWSLPIIQEDGGRYPIGSVSKFFKEEK